MVIGLTGKYCSGKNRIASLLEKQGFLVLDVDKLGYQVLETEKETIFAKFGCDLKKPDGSIDRRLLGQKVFGNLENLRTLEEIVHPKVNQMTETWLSGDRANSGDRAGYGDRAGHGDRARVINAALLHRSSVFNRLNVIILVTAPLFTRILRAKKRDRLTLKEIFKRFKSQNTFNSQYFSLKAEIYRIGNPGLIDSRFLQKKLEARLNEIVKIVSAIKTADCPDE